jgi:hypothetical protein
MTSRTRYFVIVSLLVLVVGLGTGLVVYVGGLQGPEPGRAEPEELRYVPRTATVVAFADVRDVMASDLHRRFNDAMPHHREGRRSFEDQTGINIEADIDRVIAFADGGPAVAGSRGAGLALARGRFDAVKIEGLMRAHGAEVVEYKGRRLFVSPGTDARFGLTFLEPGLAALGSARLLRSAVDLQEGGDSVMGNDELMALARPLADGNNAWVVGRFDSIARQANVPDAVMSRLPPITWFSIGTHVNGGIRGVVTAQTSDEASAANLLDVARGMLALAKLQTGSRPELQAAIQALALEGDGTSVRLSFTVPSQAFDLLGRSLERRR